MYECTGPTEWTETSVYDLADWTNGLAFKDIDFSSGGLPVIKIAELKNGVTPRTARTTAQYDPRVFVTSGDMLFSWSGNPDTSIDVFCWDGEDGWLNQHIFKVIPKQFVSHDFLFILLKSLRPRFAEIARNKQTTGLGHVTIQDLKRMRVGVPDPREQAAIVGVIGPLLQKHDLNSRNSKTLETLGCATYKDWFGDFGPVRAKADGREPYLAPPLWSLFPDDFDGALPNGWGQRPLWDMATFVNGAAYRDIHFSLSREGYPVVKIAELKTGVTANTKYSVADLGDRYRIDSGEILFSWSGNPDTSIDVFTWVGGPAWLNQHIYRVRENGFASRATIYFQLRVLKPVFAEIARNKQTTGLGHVTAGDMKRLMTVLPPEPVAKAYDALAAPLLQRIIDNHIENRTLASTSEFLLPALMRGEIRLHEAAKRAEAVL